jgi:hypothetical protein
MMKMMMDKIYWMGKSKSSSRNSNLIWYIVQTLKRNFQKKIQKRIPRILEDLIEKQKLRVIESKEKGV